MIRFEYEMVSDGLFQGDNHMRQRRVMLPGFGAPESKAFLTLFKSCAESVGIEVTQYALNTQRRCNFFPDEQQMGRPDQQFQGAISSARYPQLAVTCNLGCYR